MKNPRISGLYAITPDLEDTNALLDKVRQLLKGGAQLIQYRNKLANDMLLLEQARLLLRLCRRCKIPLIINDHVNLAAEIDADGVHVGQNDISVLDARKQLGRTKIIGASCYNSLDLALRAEKESADYIAFGAFFTSLTKPNAVSVPVNLMSQAKKKISIPMVGIGGIQLTNAKTVIQSGCAAVAVCHDVFYTENITATAAQYAQLFAEVVERI
ncbi:thiamine phosphate synthase [Nitrosomonas sp. Nm166]|uniref:thiamine phosphate synthase n=1 Tax=Nitrosomonas sp. Nm166 TaxID=1881054 RepID=UPI0008E769C4|nr:thiamine phosphate synthase [Nitrosomonas sp. Nm166]SFE75689.1 thiamine-phosphate pyrophosphorylase [Nitrosomonas sp. Nm166]